MTQTAIVWFRRDLRLTDNPALTAASSYARVIPVYIHAPEEEQPWAPGGAQRVWLHETLHALAGQLDAHGSQLVVRRGPSLETLRALVAATGATAVFWNRLYEPAIIERDKHVKQTLLDDGCEVASHNAALLCEPWRIATGSGTPYKVFTPFGRALFQRPMAAPDALPDALPPAPPGIDSLTVDDPALRPRINWDTDIRRTWTPGENGAHARLESFLGESISDYGEQRDRPAMPATSRLSPHLHFGEIGPRQVWHRVHEWLDGMRSRGPDTFLNELAWREFAHHLLYHFPQTPEEALDTRFGDFPRKDDPKVLRAWQNGRTGNPMVDAGMRELWATGWMHNRVRMVAASFLTKNLRLPWQYGERWFWNTLVDANLANNTLGWQWVAGCGADAAPYFRIFNPVRQGERFDPDGAYVRHWVPEVASLPGKHVHAPWQAPAAVLEAGDCQPGRNYPLPIVDLKASCQEALEAFETIKTGR